MLMEERAASLSQRDPDAEPEENDDGNETPRPFDPSDQDPFQDSFASAGGPGPDSMTSQSPLIHSNFPPNNGTHSPGPSQPQDQPAVDPANLDPPAAPLRSVGLVHFAEPQVQPMKRELQLRARFAQQAQKRLPRKFTRGRLRDGEIVKMEKMLVRVDVTTGSEQPGPDFDEKDSQRIETRTIEKWREFMVVCRGSHHDDAVLCLEFYKTRVSRLCVFPVGRNHLH